MLILIDSPDASTAILQSVSYDERCSSNEPMPKKIGTRAMVNGAFACIQILFPKIDTLTLTDETFFLCEGTKVANSNMSFILNGKTWYERYFEAEPVNKQNYEELKEFYYYSKLHDVPFQRIWKQSLSLTAIQKKDALSIYNSSKTWHEFYNSIIGINVCHLFILRYILHLRFFAPV
jgi:hypothetical protein